MASRNGEIALILREGGVIAYPTDTAYGLAASVESLKGVEKIFKIKGREKKKPLSVTVASLKQAKEIAEFNKNALILWKKFMPGALTIVLPIRQKLSKQKKWKLLSAGSNTIGLRLPDHPISIQLAKNAGPITATSANLSGMPAIYSSDELEKQFSTKLSKPDHIIDGGKLKKGRISTVVDCTGQDIKILRKGSVSEKQIKQALAR